MTVMAELPDVRERGLLRTICEYPEDVAARLVYADFLDETAETVPCRACKGTGITEWYDDGNACENCSGSGRVPDGRAERAEFIRVQCELATKPKCVVPGSRLCTCPWHMLHRRERELIHAHVEWADDAWPVPNHHWYPIEGGFLSFYAGAELQFRHGFVEKVTCTAWDWKDHGPAVVACQPVREVTLGDRQPQNYHNNDDAFHDGHLYGWYRGPGPDIVNDHVLLPGLWGLVAERPGCVVHGPWADFRTRTEAIVAASAACVRWARGKAGLPMLSEG